jgi:hypothetical protein
MAVFGSVVMRSPVTLPLHAPAIAPQRETAFTPPAT